MIVWKLDALMRQKRVKGRQLAKKMGIGENYLSRVRHEVPERLSLSLLDGLCRELDCTIADLLEYRHDPDQAKPAEVAPPPPVVAYPSVPAPEPAVAAEPEPVAVAEPAPEPEPVAVAEPEPVAVEAETAPEPEPVAEAVPEAPAEPHAEPHAMPAEVETPLAPVEPEPPARRGFVLEIAPRGQAPEPPPAPPRERPKLPIMPPLNAGRPAPAPEPEPEPAPAYVKGGALQAKLERLKRRRS